MIILIIGVILIGIILIAIAAVFCNDTEISRIRIQSQDRLTDEQTSEKKELQNSIFELKTERNFDRNRYRKVRKMRFVIDGVEYGVRFFYERLDDVDHHVTTNCYISRVDTTKKGRGRYTTLVAASTTNNPKYDMFVRATGRKLALSRAIDKAIDLNCLMSPDEVLSLSVFSNQMMKKANRKIVWDAFLDPVEKV